jgi:hypothetical protein
MAKIAGSVAIYLLPGMKAELSVTDYFKGVGSRKYTTAAGEEKEEKLKNGFIVMDPDVGTIEESSDKAAVIYTHKKYAQNKIFYWSRTGERGEVDIIAVPIHDHASIVTGGPAYGTYYTDDETLGET